MVSNTYAYASQLNQWANQNNVGITFFVSGGDDIETNFSDPYPVVDSWVSAWDNSAFAYRSSAYMEMYDNGAQYDYCNSSSCWDQPLDHNWSSHQLWQEQWGYGSAFSFPEMYRRNWGYYYEDLNKAAAAANKPTVGYTGVMWGCGTGGDEPSANQAHVDFSAQTGQSPQDTTTIHALDQSC